MSRRKSILSVIFTAALMCAFAISASAQVNITFKGDIDGDRVLSSGDARLVHRTVDGLEPMPEKDSEAYYRMSLTGSDEICMEDARTIQRIIYGRTDYSSLYTKEELTDMFNMLVNQIKTAEFMLDNKITYFNHYYQTNTTSDYDFGEFNKLFSDFLGNTDSSDDSFGGITKNMGIYINNYPVTNETTVSTLTADDIESIKVAFVSHPDVLDAIPDSSTGTDSGNFSVYKNKKTGSLIKFTVKVKGEDYNTIKNLPADKKTPIQKIFDLDLRSYVSEINDSINSSEQDMFTTSGNTQNAYAYLTADYYFGVKNLEPALSHYFTGIEADIDVNISILDDELLIPGLRKLGSLREHSVVNTDYYYLFSDFYS